MTVPKYSAGISLRVVWPIVAAVAFMATQAWTISEISPLGFLLGLAPAAVWAVIIVMTMKWLDSWERERPALFASAFVWGAAIAGLGSIYLQEWLEALIRVTAGPEFLAWFGPLVTTPVTEEVLKGLFLIWLLWRRRRQISGLLDGIIYGGLIGAGFAFSEGIYYFGGAIVNYVNNPADAAVLSNLVATLILRGVLFPFMHSFFTALTGLSVAVATRARRGAPQFLTASVGLVVAIGLHGFWDYASLFGSRQDPLMLFKFWGFLILPLTIAMAIFAIVLRRREARTIAEALPLLAAKGEIAREEVSDFKSLRSRRQWRASWRRERGRRAAKLLGRYQAEVGSLALSEARDAAADDIAAQRADVQSARKEMLTTSEDLS